MKRKSNPPPGKRKPRDTQARRIQEAVAENDLPKAAYLADYGDMGNLADEFAKMDERDSRTTGLMINLLFSQRRLEREYVLLDKALKEFGVLFTERIAAGDHQFFRDFADQLAMLVKFVKISGFENPLRDSFRAELIFRRIMQERNGAPPINLREVAEKHEISLRHARRINKEIGAKTLPRGRPQK